MDKIYIFSNKFSLQPEGCIQVGEFFRALKEGRRLPMLERAYELSAGIKNATTVNEVQGLKANLPLLRCVNAIKLENVTEWNGLMGFDLDAKDNPTVNNSLFMNMVFAGLHKLGIGLYFASYTPSGGLRFFVRTEGISRESYSLHHESLRVKLERETGLKLDASVKNINRGFFIYTESHSTFFDSNSKPYTVEAKETAKKKANYPTRTGRSNSIVTNEAEDCIYFERALKQTEAAGREFIPGQRHTFVTSLAGRLSLYGVSLEYAKTRCAGEFSCEGFEVEEITRILEDIYRNNTANGSLGSLRRNSEFELDVEIERVEIGQYIAETKKLVDNFMEIIFNANGHVEVVAPTGSGKTTSFKYIVDFALPFYDKIVICAPNKGITKQIAERMGVAPITEDLRGEERQEAKAQGVIVCTYNQLASLAEGFPGSMLLILDEAHCLTEEFRANTMSKTLEVIKRSSKTILFTATPNNLVTREAGVKKRIIFECKKIQKKVIEEAIEVKGGVAKAMPTVVANALGNSNGIISVYVNSGSVIRKIIDELLGAGVLSHEEIGVYASRGLIRENELQIYDVTECIESERRVRDGVKLLLCTKAAEYGIDILNENIERVFLVEQAGTTLTVDEIHQHTSRFRNIKNIPITIISANKNSKNKEYSIMSLTEIFEKEIQIAEATCAFFNERLRKEFSLGLAETDSVIRQQRNKFIKRASKDEYTYFDAEEQAFKANRLAVIQAATKLYNDSLTLEEKIEQITKQYGFVNGSKKVETGEVKGGALKIGNEVVGETLDNAQGVGEHRKEALKRILEIKEEYVKKFGTSSPPFSAVFLKLAMEEYNFTLPKWIAQACHLNIEGVRRDVNGELLSKNFQPYEEYKFIKERLGDAYYVSKMRNVLPTFLLYASIEFNNAFELAVHSALNKRVSEVVNYFYTHNLVRLLKAGELEKYDIKFLCEYEGITKLYDELNANYVNGEWFRVKDVCERISVQYTQREGNFVATVFKTETKVLREGSKLTRYTKITKPTTINESLEKYNVTLSLPENLEETLSNYVGAYAYNIEESKQQPIRVKPKPMPRPTVTPEEMFGKQNYLHEEIPEITNEAPF